MHNMKLVFLIFTMMAVVLSAHAHEGKIPHEQFTEQFPWKHEFRVGYGGCPYLDGYEYFTLYSNDCSGLDVTSLSYLYGKRSGSEYCTGVFSMEYSLHLNRWFTLCAYVGINGMWAYSYDPYTRTETDRRNGVSFNIMPLARFHWANTELVRMYSAVGVGLYASVYDRGVLHYPAFQLTPVGISVGRRVMFYAEATFGTASLGGNFGIGYRF